MTVRLNKRNGAGDLSCVMCGRPTVRFQPIDVGSDAQWFGDADTALVPLCPVCAGTVDGRVLVSMAHAAVTAGAEIGVGIETI